MSDTATKTILFAGGGTGGHFFPNMAVAERLGFQRDDVRVHFVVSQRPLDAQIMERHELAYTAVPVQAWRSAPLHWPAFYRKWRDSVATIRQLIDEHAVAAVVTTGGYVSAPALWAAKQRAKGQGPGAKGCVSAMVNLDAVPGRANRWMARWADKLFTVYPTARLPSRQETIGLPLRRCALKPSDPLRARKSLGLDPDRPTLLVTGASQGARSINAMMLELIRRARPRHELSQWQVVHLAGATDLAELRQGYEQAGIAARVEAFWDQMGDAWGAATLAISRAGAGSVAEARANHVPTIFLPYPYHKDQHQRFNCEPLTRTGAAVILRDQIDPKANASQIAGPLKNLMANTAQRQHMINLLQRDAPPNGATTVAQWLMDRIQ